MYGSTRRRTRLARTCRRKRRRILACGVLTKMTTMIVMTPVVRRRSHGSIDADSRAVFTVVEAASVEFWRIRLSNVYECHCKMLATAPLHNSSAPYIHCKTFPKSKNVTTRWSDIGHWPMSDHPLGRTLANDHLVVLRFFDLGRVLP